MPYRSNFIRRPDPAQNYIETIEDPSHGYVFGQAFAKNAGAFSGKEVVTRIANSFLRVVDCVTDKFVGSASDRGGLLNDGMRYSSNAIRMTASKVLKSTPRQQAEFVFFAALAIGIPVLAYRAWRKEALDKKAEQAVEDMDLPSVPQTPPSPKKPTK